MVDQTSKGLTNLGLWLLLLVGIVVAGFVAWGFVAVFMDPTVPAWLKALLLVALIGAVILLVVVVRDRLKEAKSDPYKDIEI